MDVSTAIRARHSTRRYVDERVPARLLEHLLAFASDAELPGHPGTRVTLVNGRKQVGRILARYAGVYGLVQGAPHLLVGLIRLDTDLERLALGYALEQVVLEATRLGMSTCWITGTYDPAQAARLVDLSDGEIVAAVVALGYAHPGPLARLHDRAVRRLVAAHRRRRPEEIVFAGRWGRHWLLGEAEPAVATLVECARLAPSARNRQPWRFVVGPEELSLALVERAPIDGGIVMAHVALAAMELGRPGAWSVRWGDPALAASLELPPSAVPVGTFPL